MLTEKECLAIALDMRLRAQVHQGVRENYLRLSREWEHLAERATWQDGLGDIAPESRRDLDGDSDPLVTTIIAAR